VVGPESGRQGERLSSGEEVVCPISGLLFFSFFFLFFDYPAFIVSRYKKPHVALAMEKTKPIRQIHGLLHLFMVKIKHPEAMEIASPA